MAFTFYEFFAGGGMVCQGLGGDWQCLFANDIDGKKAKSYRANNDPSTFIHGDIKEIQTEALQGQADLAWASFPCQDLSLAGSGAGLDGERSGSFWAFWHLMEELDQKKRAPSTIILENVPGLVTSSGGHDFYLIANAIADAGYTITPLIIDAALFVPQSRPRLFLIGIRSDLSIPETLLCNTPSRDWTTPALLKSIAALSPTASEAITWLNLPSPPHRNSDLASVLDWKTDAGWNTSTVTQSILAMMDARNVLKVKAAKRKQERIVGAIYKRTRLDKDHRKTQRAEVRFDGLAGCLRTPGGGSSRQTLLFVNGNDVRSRLLLPRESARLMGLSDNYILPKSATQAYHLTGDGVCVPVVRFLKEAIIEPILMASFRKVTSLNIKLKPVQ